MERIYQVLPRLWGRGKFSCWDRPQLDYLKSLGITAVWFTGVPRHAAGEAYVKGDWGSPYAISDYFDVNPYLADSEENRLDEFRALVGRVHEAGLKVITDLVPNHVAPSCRDLPTHPWCDYDWTDTRKVDYSNPETLPKLIEIVRFWASMGVDGLRCDMVELVPAEALRELIAATRECFPGFLFIAECYERSNYGRFCSEVGFDLLYDKSGFYDIVRGIICQGASARGLTWNWQRLGVLQPRMLNFLENHDEQRFASVAYAGSVERSYAALAFGALFNGASFLLYAGGELGEDAAAAADSRTSIFNHVAVPSLQALEAHIRTGAPLPEAAQRSLARYREILSLSSDPLFSRGGCHDLCYCNLCSPGFDPDRHFAFVRFAPDRAVLVFCNFSDSPAQTRVFIPDGVLPQAQKNDGQETPSAINVHAEAWDAAIIRL